MHKTTYLSPQKTKAFIHTLELLDDPFKIELILSYEDTLSTPGMPPNDTVQALLLNLICMEGLSLTLVMRAAQQSADKWFKSLDGLRIITANSQQEKVIGQTRWRLLQQTEGSPLPIQDQSANLLLVIGSNEDWFRAAHAWSDVDPDRQAYTIQMSSTSTPSTAEFHIRSTQALIEFLSGLSDAFQINCYK